MVSHPRLAQSWKVMQRISNVILSNGITCMLEFRNTMEHIINSHKWSFQVWLNCILKCTRNKSKIPYHWLNKCRNHFHSFVTMSLHFYFMFPSFHFYDIEIANTCQHQLESKCVFFQVFTKLSTHVQLSISLGRWQVFLSDEFNKSLLWKHRLEFEWPLCRHCERTF